jgi:hypothetical protein
MLNTRKFDIKDPILSHLDVFQGSTLYSLFNKYEAIFEGKLGTMPGPPYNTPIRQDVTIRPLHLNRSAFLMFMFKRSRIISKDYWIFDSLHQMLTPMGISLTYHRV